MEYAINWLSEITYKPELIRLRRINSPKQLTFTSR